MKKNIFFVLLICTAMFGCKKDPIHTYNSTDNIYLNYPNTDSLVYSFAFNQGSDRDTIWVPVSISGTRANHDKKFVLSVVDGATTAVRTLHFEPLKPFYIMPADSGTTHVPVIIRNIDTGLVNYSVILTVRVSGGTDFNSNLPEDIRTKRIFFSNRLEQPAWWQYWGQLGSYSRTKHQLFLISSGTTDLVEFTVPDFYLQIPRDLYYIGNTHEFLTYPFDWVQQHPEKGYVLTKRTDGTGDYDFYNVNAPNKKFQLKYFSQTGTYIFIDEYGGQIII
jgi:hypothetical protein